MPASSLTSLGLCWALTCRNCGACVLIKGGCANTCLHGVSVCQVLFGQPLLGHTTVFSLLMHISWDQASEEKATRGETESGPQEQVQVGGGLKTRCAEGLGCVDEVGGWQDVWITELGLTTPSELSLGVRESTFL